MKRSEIKFPARLERRIADRLLYYLQGENTMEMKSEGFTKLAFIDSSHSYADKHDMVSNITRLIGSLLDLRDSLDNSLSISVTIDVSVGPDNQYLEETEFDDDEDDEDSVEQILVELGD